MHSLLRNGDFVRLFAGRLITNVGDSLYFVAAMWLVYDLTGDPAFSGIAGFLTLAPSALQAFFGPLVDRFSLRRILVGTQAAQGVLILAIPAIHYYGALSVWVVLAVMPLLSLLNQLVYPAQSAALPRLVDQEELVAANSAFSLAYQGTDAIANALGGVLVAALGAVTLFLVDSVTFAAAALLFATLSVGAGDAEDHAAGESRDADAPVATDGGDDVADGEADAAPSSYWTSLREGVDYVRGTVLVAILAGAALVNFVMGGAVMAAMPAFADTLGGATAYGVLMAATAAGMFVGAVGASALKDRAFGWLTIACFLVSGLLWIAAILAAWLPATAALFCLALIPVGIGNVLLSSMVQAAVPDDLLGRVSALLGSVSSVSVPIGALLGGVLTGVVGPDVLLTVAGVGPVLFALYWLARPELRTLPAIGDVETLELAE